MKLLFIIFGGILSSFSFSFYKDDQLICGNGMLVFRPQVLGGEHEWWVWLPTAGLHGLNPEMYWLPVPMSLNVNKSVLCFQIFGAIDGEDAIGFPIAGGQAANVSSKQSGGGGGPGWIVCASHPYTD
jgi:hypothetical protein